MTFGHAPPELQEGESHTHVICFTDACALIAAAQVALGLAGGNAIFVLELVVAVAAGAFIAREGVLAPCPPIRTA